MSEGLYRRSLFPHNIALPAIDGMTIPYDGQNFLRTGRFLDVMEAIQQTPHYIIPGSILYATIGVKRKIELRRIPVAMEGEGVYPISTQAIPGLHSRLLIDADKYTIRFQGGIISYLNGKPHQYMKLIGLNLTFTVLSYSAQNGLSD